MIKKIEKKVAKSSKKPDNKKTKKIEDLYEESLKGKDIETTCIKEEKFTCKKKRSRLPFRILSSLLLIIGLLWFAQIEFFTKSAEVEESDTDMDIEKIEGEEVESFAEIIDAETGEVIEIESTEDDYSAEVEELKREDMPKKISDELGEFNGNGFYEDGNSDVSFDEASTEEDGYKSKTQEEKLQEMEVQLNESNQKIEQLTKELTKTSAEIKSTKFAQNKAPLIIKLVNLKDKIAMGENFQSDLDDLEYFANGDVVILKTIEDIRKYSDGLKTKTLINKEFQSSVLEVMKEHNAPAETDTFLSKIMYNITKNIVIRKVDESAKPSETEQILINAEKFLSKEKYKEAVLEVIKLDEKYSESFDEWIDDTSEFVYVNEVLYQVIKYAEENK